MIISASRRTDIPAFFSKWFFNRIEAGFLLVRNPFNTYQIKKISLLPDDVDVIVFWTKNAAPIIPSLRELDEINIRYYFQYTITAYPRALERYVPHPEKSIEIFSTLSDAIGKERVVWRYDPILLSNLVNISEHKRIFEKIASKLTGKTNRVVISFADIYKKTKKNLDHVSGLEYVDILRSQEELFDLLSCFSEVATHYGMEIQTCSESFDLTSLNIKHGKCIDDELIKSVYNIDVLSGKDPGQRAECGCVKSIDIGQYNTCRHGCSYCYATYSDQAVEKNQQRHDPDSPFLVGGIEGVSSELLNPPVHQKDLFELLEE